MTGEIEAQIDRAESLNDLGRHAEAVQLLGPVFAAQPDHPWAMCAMARAQLGLQHYADALGMSARAAGVLPHLAWPALLASWAAGGLDRDGEAVEWAKEAVRRDPHNPLCHQRVAYTMLAVGEFGIAQDAAAHCLALDPDRADAHVLCGILAHEYGQRDRAEAFYRQALAIDPQNSRAHQGMARLSMSADRFVDGRNLAEAAERMATAVRADPKSPEIRGMLDVILHKFLARAAYFLCVGVIIARFVLDGAVSTTARLIPVALLAVPAFFIYRFLRNLPPVLRGHLAGMLRGRRIAAPVALLVVALAFLLAGVLVPPHLQIPTLGGALLLAVTARIQMEAEFRRVQRRLDPTMKPFLRTWLLWPVFLVVGLLTFAMVLAAGTGSSPAFSFVLALCFVLMTGWLALTVWTRHAGHPPGVWQRISATDLVPAGVAAALGLAAAAAVLHTALTQGAPTTFDRAAAERRIAADLSQRHGATAEVTCPDDVLGYVGEAFRCRVQGIRSVSSVEVILGPDGTYEPQLR